jgi:hypothetical protein
MHQPEASGVYLKACADAFTVSKSVVGSQMLFARELDNVQRAMIVLITCEISWSGIKSMTYMSSTEAVFAKASLSSDKTANLGSQEGCNVATCQHIQHTLAASLEAS